MLRLLLVAAVAATLPAQILTGGLDGTIFAPDGRPRAGLELTVTGATGFEIKVTTDEAGHFALVLPYGLYRVNGVVVRVDPLATTHADLVLNPLAAMGPPEKEPVNLARRAVNPEPFNLQGGLLSLDPAAVSEPLDFTGLADNRLAVVSVGSSSWAATQFRVEGMDATDSYQPGRPVTLPDVQALETTVVRSAFALQTSGSYGAEAGVYLAQPGAAWHGALETDGSGAPLASGIAEQYGWMTRDHAEVGGHLTRWADVFASGTGQWSSQSLPLVDAGTNQRSRMLYGNIRGRVRPGPRDFLDALYSGSRVDLSNGGMPAGFEALAGRRMSPEFSMPGGFANQAEVDHLDFVQTGWTHLFAPGSRRGALEARYGYATTHMDTREASASVPDQSRIDLVTDLVSGAAPLGNFAVRTRHELAATWQPAVGRRQRLTVGGGWETSAPRNRFSVPGNLNLITANGAPAFVVAMNTPVDSTARVAEGSVYANDHLNIASGLTADVGLLSDFSRGRLSAGPDLISWNGVSPRAGLVWQIPRARGLEIQAGWFRLQAPLAGRYLDFGNPNSLGGNVYQWTDRNGDGWFQPGEQGPLITRFGGPYSSIDPSLRRTYADEIHVGVQMPFGHTAIAGLRLFRRDEKQRIAAVNTGVPPPAFTPKTVIDPGPDGSPGTFDDSTLTVWAQNPATFGQDHYVLTNPAGLRMQNTGFVAEVASSFRGVTLRASFTAEKSYGPTNPGNAVFEDDSGVVGSLYADPNTLINASNRTYLDRAFVGKVQGVYRLPARLGGIQVASIAGYVDGLVFARELLVTGLAQGPFLVPATVRGSPEGGNRARYIPSWNLRASRDFRLPFGNVLAAADVMNVTNAAHAIQQSDVTGPNFNLRLPVEVQPARFVRLELRYDF
ncbi:MAG TPA: carboxypeptidase-like regulatory domain-containing protein [Bryobacteraceae bacterium]|nr:carboxypeptidase-like regulatory domain-containing protein [Bryobacteraceae bacterium]